MNIGDTLEIRPDCLKVMAIQAKSNGIKVFQTSGAFAVPEFALVGYEPKPKYYSGTVICGYCEDGLFTEHKAYIVKDGELISDNGTIRRFISIEDINKAYSASSFFELIEATT